MTAICRLCGEQKKLSKAHIIPKSFYRAVTLSEMKLVSSDVEKRPARNRSGVYDENILCLDCDGNLNKIYDQPAYIGLIKSTPTPLIRNGNVEGNFYYNIKSDLCYLFILSMLWRASVSSHPFFNSVFLGNYERIIYDYISEKVEFNIDCENRIKICLFEYKERHIPMLSPIRSKFSGINYYRFYFSNLCALIKFDKRPGDPAFDGTYLRSARPTFSIFRDWAGSKEKDAMRNMIKSCRHKIF